jgi:hypothetical protein
MNPALILTTTGPTPKVETKHEVQDTQIVISLKLINSETPRYITTLTIPSELHTAAGISKIEDFELKPWNVSDGYTQEEADVENKKSMRYVGDLKLEPKKEYSLKIPIGNNENLNGSITGWFESKKSFGGSMSFFYVEIGMSPNKSSNSDAVNSAGS